MTNLVIMAITIITNFYQAYDPIATSNANVKAGYTNGVGIYFCTSNTVCCEQFKIDVGFPRYGTNGNPIYLFSVFQIDRKEHWNGKGSFFSTEYHENKMEIDRGEK